MTPTNALESGGGGRSRPGTGVVVATAGWAIPRAAADAFPETGSGLERYARRFRGVEINTTFYRAHRAGTYARWAAATPADFRFAVKLPKAITHLARLIDARPLVRSFREEVRPLGDKLGPLLVQLPPSLIHLPSEHGRFFADLAGVWPGQIVCEPRHVSWFEPGADAMFMEHRVSRVAADPARHPDAGRPGGFTGFAYWRLHGSPRLYSSSYDGDALAALVEDLEHRQTSSAWCVFDNTMSGAAAVNALDLARRLKEGD